MLVADVAGLSHYHVGDEAILTARLAWVRKTFPAVTPIALSHDPSFTAARHSVQALEEPSLPRWVDQSWVYRWSCPALSARLLEILCRGFAPRLGAVLREVRQTSLLCICGGGSLTSTYGALLRFRSLLAGYALASGVPVAVSGQQIGPALTREDAAILKRWLPGARYVGVRDPGVSVAVGRDLGLQPGHLVVTGDDALDLAPSPVERGIPGRSGTRPLVGLSLHLRGGRAEREQLLARMVSALAGWLRDVEADLLWLPHLRSDVAHRCDIRLAHDFARESGLGNRLVIADDRHLLDSHIKYLTGRCQFVVSTRYHGAVFALSSGVPVVALSQDDYTHAKLKGLLEYCDLQWPVTRLDDPATPLALRAAWENRPVLAGQLSALWPVVSRKYQDGWLERARLLTPVVGGSRREPLS